MTQVQQFQQTVIRELQAKVQKQEMKINELLHENLILESISIDQQKKIYEMSNYMFINRVDLIDSSDYDLDYYHEIGN